MKILLPVDGSPFSESALPVAQALSQSFQAEILLVRVIDPFVGVAPGVPTMALRLVEHEQTEAGPYLHELEQRLTGTKGVRSLRPMGSPRESLIKVAAEEHCDLIVMASHGRSGITRWLLGSVTEAVLRQSPCPVLVVRPETPAPQGGFRNVLVPLDGSESSQAVIEKLTLCLASDAKVTLLRASELGDSEHSVLIDSKTREIFLESLETELRAVKVAQWQVECRVVDGHAADCILSIAEEGKNDLIAMATHGRTGFRRMVLGSVTERVLRHATCPVLTYPCHAED